MNKFNQGSKIIEIYYGDKYTKTGSGMKRCMYASNET